MMGAMTKAERLKKSRTIKKKGVRVAVPYMPRDFLQEHWGKPVSDAALNKVPAVDADHEDCLTCLDVVGGEGVLFAHKGKWHLFMFWFGPMNTHNPFYERTAKGRSLAEALTEFVEGFVIPDTSLEYCEKESDAKSNVPDRGCGKCPSCRKQIKGQRLLLRWTIQKMQAHGRMAKQFKRD